MEVLSVDHFNAQLLKTPTAIREPGSKSFIQTCAGIDTVPLALTNKARVGLSGLDGVLVYVGGVWVGT